MREIYRDLWDFFRTAFHPSTTLQIAKAALGKYIIIFACFLHIVWAVILAIDIRAVNATPLAILFALCNHDRVFTIVNLLLVAFLAGAFLDIRLRQRLSISALSLFLVPQQVFLWCSAGNGIYCAVMQKYADGTPMSWPHILTDQTPVVAMALLYTVAILESRFPPEITDVLQAQGVKLLQGAQGIQGIQGIQGVQGESIRGLRGERGERGESGKNP